MSTRARPLNMRVTANSSQGHRKYMEDCYKIRFQRDTANITAGDLDSNNNQQSDILFSYFGIFDGHGGAQASQYCKQHLYWSIVRQEGFWAEDDSAVLDAIRKGFIQCHDDMWSQLPSWPRTASGLPSTSGTTATVVFIKGSRVYVGHVGDSGLAVGLRSRRGNSETWEGRKMTRDHKPEDPVELKRILGVGGDVQLKSGVNRVVWNRPVFDRFQSRNFKSQSGLTANNNNNQNEGDHKLLSSHPSTPYELNYLRNQPNTPTERIPFLAVARSLGDLWSYSSTHNDYVVSPVPDTFYFDLDPAFHKCLILATDGLWNVISVNECVELVRQTDRETEEMNKRGQKRRKSETSMAAPFVNPSQRLVQTAIQRCCEKMIRADNTTCITIMLDLPPDYVDESPVQIRPPLNVIHSSNRDQYNEIDDTDIDLYDEADDGVMSEFGDETKNRSRCSRRPTGPAASSTMLVEAHSEPELATPMHPNDPGDDKRSRSLTSLRRRHWSASSNRSSSVFSVKPEERCRPTRQQSNLTQQTADKRSYIKSTNPSLKTNSTIMNHAVNRPSASNRHRSNVNLSTSMCSFVSAGRKQLRKSVNDLLEVTSTKLSSRRDEESTKENKIKLSKPVVASPKSNGYAKRLKRLKNTLIKTKNSLFNRKPVPKPVDEPVIKQKSTSSSGFNKLNMTTGVTEIPANTRFDLELDTNQSFVNSFRSRFMKRSRSSKLNNLNSTSITTKLSNTVLGEPSGSSLAAASKRPRFY